MSTPEPLYILGAGMHPWGKWGRDFTEYGVVAQLGNHDEVAVISKKIVRDGKGYYWAKVKVAVSQSKYVEGWVCSKYAKGVWH